MPDSIVIMDTHLLIRFRDIAVLVANCSSYWWKMWLSDHAHNASGHLTVPSLWTNPDLAG